MKKKNIVTMLLAGTGTVLVWFPILVPILPTIFTFSTSHIFRFDYLMSAELLPFALAGGGQLLWAALGAPSPQRLVGWGLGIAAGSLLGGQGLAVVTGLASGKTAPTGWFWLLVLASLIICSLALVAMGVGEGSYWMIYAGFPGR